MKTTALRDFLSHDWQDLAAVSREIYNRIGIPIKPDRLGRILTSNYPDVVVSDGTLVRIVAQEISHASHPQPTEPQENQRRRA